jgi:hypothetical protein
MGLWTSKIQPEGKPRFWYRDNFFITTDKSYLDAKLIDDVFKSDLMWWNSPLGTPQMKKMLDNCLTVAMYWVPETEEQMRSQSRHLLIQERNTV